MFNSVVLFVTPSIWMFLSTPAGVFFMIVVAILLFIIIGLFIFLIGCEKTKIDKNNKNEIEKINNKDSEENTNKKDYEKRIESGDGVAANNLGVIYENEGEIDIAKKYYEKAEKLKTANNE